MPPKKAKTQVLEPYKVELKDGAPIERLAEHARGDIGGEVGRREIGAGHPKVSRAVERYEVLLGEGRQRSEAKLIVADEQGLSKRRVEDYIKLHRERKEQVALLTAQYAIK